MPKPSQHARYDAVVIGSGFGGAMAAHELVSAGLRVLMLERGGWVERGAQNWDAVDGFFQRTPAYTTETRYAVEQQGRREAQGICACVGGASVFYGGAAFRFRTPDFEAAPEVVADSGARWPIGYSDLEPYYAQAERLLAVAGTVGEDPTEPPRAAPFPQEAPPLAGAARRIAQAARELGLHPSRIPLAINRTPERAGVCRSCVTCDGFACAVEAKGDLATLVIPQLLAAGMRLRTETVVTRLVAEGGRVVAVEAVDRRSGERLRFVADRVVLSAGALASPHLLLTSGLERLNPGGDVVGRYLMRHCNAFVYGVFARPPNPAREHHKQVAILDFYLGDPEGDAPAGKLGSLQQVMAPLPGAPLRAAPRALPGGRLALRALGGMLQLGLRHLTGLLAIAEDQPDVRNRVELLPGADAFGLPRVRVVHRYSERDLQARRALVRRARQILRAAGARATLVHPITTFSHAVGTVRMGEDPARSALDEICRFRGLDNLYVVDGSFMPTSAGVNPSLTIAANALRVGREIARRA